VRLVRIDNSNIVDGEIRGGALVGRVSTNSDGRFSIRMPARTRPDTCRFYLEAGANGNRTLPRAFVYAPDVDINFESEATLRLLLDQIKAGTTTLCDLTPGDIQLVTTAVVSSDRQ